MIVTPGTGGVAFSLFQEQAVQAIVIRKNGKGGKAGVRFWRHSPPGHQDFATSPEFPCLKMAMIAPYPYLEGYFFAPRREWWPRKDQYRELG
jgi:hypothetical protein